MATTSCLPVGATAPAFVIRGPEDEALAVGPTGRPRVLAFVHTWRIVDERAGQIRARLRELGAEMTLLSSSSAWSFRPDDLIEMLPCAPDGVAGELRAIAQLYGVEPGSDAVFVIDEHRVIAFSHAPNTSLSGRLAGALGAAVDALHRRDLQAAREQATACLVTGFAAALFG